MVFYFFLNIIIIFCAGPLLVKLATESLGIVVKTACVPDSVIDIR